jgi:uncharacterized protein (DUF58 family)
MTADKLRGLLIAMLAICAVVSVIANKSGSKALGILSFTLFLATVFVYFQWRRRARQERRARVFDREAKTDETGTRSDQ